MAAYRVYCLDGANRFVRVEPVDADNDEVAVEIAKLVVDDCFHFEVWDRDRLVKRITRPN